MALDPVLGAIVTICILVFSAKVLGEIFSWRKIPAVLGELLASNKGKNYISDFLDTLNGDYFGEI
jgi:hypothetical protein